MNIGKRKLIKYRGNEIYTGIYKYPVNEAIMLGVTDVAGDEVIDRKYHGGTDKACYLYGANHYNFWKKELPKLDWHFGMFGENITVDGLVESCIRIGDVFKLGTAVVQVTQPRQPCYKLGIRLENPKAVKQFVKAELPGVYLRIIEAGEVKRGDTMELISSNVENHSVREIFHLLYHPNEKTEEIKKAIGIIELADSCRKDLIKFAKLK